MSDDPTIVACPQCRRALQRPREAFGRLVRCPVCLTSFASESAPLWASPRFRSPKLSNDTADGAAVSEVVLTLANEDEPQYAVGRVDSPEWTEFCPLCESAVPPYLNACPKCRAEFLPLEEVTERPWETQGAERRDSEPHRGNLLLTLSIVSCVISSVACYLCFFGVVLNLVGIALGGAAVSVGLRDLRKIRQGTMHSGGRSMSKAATILGSIGVLLNVASIIAMLVMLGTMFL